MGDNNTISAPYSHKNLSVYLIHGKDRLPGHGFLTLQEALEQKKVIVHETGQVNALAVENLSGEDVFVQSGVTNHKNSPTLAYRHGQCTTA